jgi:hypothetical protein
LAAIKRAIPTKECVQKGFKHEIPTKECVQKEEIKMARATSASPVQSMTPV